MKTVLLLSTYPFAEPRHGGQVRLANIAKSFANEGWVVESLAVYEPESYSTAILGKNDVAFPKETEYRKFRGRDVPLVNDLLAGKYASADDGGFRRILSKLPQRVDVIHVEQPWLWPLARRIKSIERYANTRLIYGSQNIEAPLKREILESYHIRDCEDVIEEVLSLEKAAASEANVAVAVTKADLDVLSSWGAQSPVLAPNGIAPWEAEAERLDHWSARLPKSPWLLYVASAHPPNFTGFEACLGGTLGCIPPDSKLVVAGSVCEHLHRTLSVSTWSSLNLSRLELLFLLSDEDLAAVKCLAHGFLLPIPHGGGSNIKTAEALYSGKYVIGSEAAFRGYENYVDFTGVSVARTPAEFHAAIREVLGRPEAAEIAAERQRRNSLTWQCSLAPIVVGAESFAAGRAL